MEVITKLIVFLTQDFGVKSILVFDLWIMAITAMIILWLPFISKYSYRRQFLEESIVMRDFDLDKVDSTPIESTKFPSRWWALLFPPALSLIWLINRFYITEFHRDVHGQISLSIPAYSLTGIKAGILICTYLFLLYNSYSRYVGK